MGDRIRLRNATCLSHEGVVPQFAYEGIRGSDTKDVLGYESVEQNSGGVTLGASPNRAYQGINEGVHVQTGKDSLELLDDGWHLNWCADKGTINVSHGKRNLPGWLGAVRC